MENIAIYTSLGEFLCKIKSKHLCGDETIYKMLTLNFSEEEIRRLKNEKDFNPCVLIRKRSHVVYLKMSHKTSNEVIGGIVCCHRNRVSNWIKIYQSGGISSLLEINYYCPESELE